MSEPRRLLEESDSPLERALLSAGTSYQAGPETRAKTLAALGLAGAAGLSASIAAGTSTIAATETAAVSSSIAAKLGWAKVLMLLSTAGAVAAIPASYYALSDPTPQVAPLDRFAGALEGPVERAKVAPPPVPVEPRAEEARAEVPPVAAAPPVHASSTAAPRPAAKPSTSSIALQEELSALDAARTTLSSGNAQGALSLLDAYARSYPRGRLRLEAEVLRIDALARSGRLDLAKRRAEAFLAGHPNSVLASRVRRYVNE